MSTYTARAEWDDDGWWVITASDVPGAISQCRRLDQAAENIAEAISLMVDSFHLPRHHPHPATNRSIHGVVSGEPGAGPRRR